MFRIRFSSAVLLLVAVCFPSSFLLAQRRPMRFDDLIKVRQPEDIDLSPGGRWAMFTVTDVNLQRNTRTPHLWIVPLGGGREKQITASMAGESGGRFSPDGKQILFLSTRSGVAQVSLASFDSSSGTIGEPRPLTHLSTGAFGAVWAPDGAHILFASSVYPECTGSPQQTDACNRQRDEREQDSPIEARLFTHLFFRHWDHYMGEKRDHLFLIPASGGDARDLTPGVTQDLSGYTFSPDGKEIAFEWNTDPDPALSTNSDIYTLSLVQANARPLRISTSPGGDFTPRYSPNGRYIAFRSQARAGYESDRFRLMLYDRQSKQIRELLPGFDHWVDELAWAADSKRLYFVSGVAGEEPVFEVDTGGRSLSVLTGPGAYGDLHATRDGRKLVLTRETFREPGEIYALRLSKPSSRTDSGILANIRYLRDAHGARPVRAHAAVIEESQLTHMNSSLLAQLDLPDQEPFWFEGAQRTRVEGFLLKPPGFDPHKKYPVKFLLHGGPEGAFGNHWGDSELLAASGYVLVMINFRGSTGYGQSFIDQIDGDWGGKPYIDLMRGLDYVEAHSPFIDKSRECALGGSFGGYMANWILGHTHRFKCIVSTDGVFDTESDYGTTDELWFPEWEFKGTPWTNRATYRRWSPMMAAANFKTPTLVVHGQLDYRLDVSQGFALFTTLQRLKVPSEMLYFPDERHVILKPRNLQLWYKTVDDWVDRWTR